MKRGAGVRGAFLFQVTILRRRAVVLGGGGVALLVTALLTLVTILNSGPEPDSRRASSYVELEKPQGVVQAIVNGRFFLGLLMLVVGASAIATAYSLGTLRVLLVREPRRLRLLAGLVLGVVAVSAVIAVLCLALSVVMSFLLASGKGIDTSAWTTSDGLGWLFSTLGQLVLAMAGFAALGCALAVVLRTPVASIALGVLYLLVIENLVIGLAWDGGRDWLPGQVLQGIASGGVSGNDSQVPGFDRSLVLGLVYTVVLSAGCGALFTRRDVSL